MVFGGSLINLDEGLGRLGGSMQLYKRLLVSFKDGNYLKDLEDQMENGDAAQASVAAHTLKGVSANLSLTRVNEITIEIEKQLKAGVLSMEYVPDLKEAFAKTAEEIDKL